jgi:hypothetical protein
MGAINNYNWIGFSPGFGYGTGILNGYGTYLGTVQFPPAGWQ